MICGVTGNRLAVILLAAACVVAVASLVLRADGFCRDSLQVEFSTYYAAGEALNCGLSPYVNNVDHVPPIWDGLDRYRHSRFLYPPLAATLFRAFALLPYATAKVIWTILNALFVAAAIYAAAKASGPRSSASKSAGTVTRPAARSWAARDCSAVKNWCWFVAEVALV